MRSIRALYEKVREENPVYSDYVCFSMAIEKKGLKKEAIYRAFNKLVPKDDYINGKREILSYLTRHSQKNPEDYLFESKLSISGVKN
jgi:deoxyhypusine synthase